MKRIAVFCASSSGKNKVYLESAYQLGKKIAQKQYELVYGGAAVGLMGALAKGALENDGTVIGVLPKFLDRKELAQKELSQLIMVESMHERKMTMNDLSDGSITLPGGFGTLEEFFEMITWAQLGLHQKPTALLNINGYYDPLIAQLQKMNHEKLLRDEHLKLLIIENTIEAILDRMESYQAPDSIKQWLSRGDT